MIIGTVAAMDRAPVNMDKHFTSFRPTETSPGVTGRKRWEVRENNSKKADESRQLGTKVEIESKSVIPHTKRKTNPCELSQETLKKPRSCLGMQVGHAQWIKTDSNPGLSSSKVLGNSKEAKMLPGWLHSLLTNQDQML